MNFAIIGAGNTGKAYSVYLTHLGHQVTLFSRTAERLIPIREQGITATGVVEGHFSVPVSDNLSQVKAADVILICTVAAAHRPVAERISGHLESGQLIVITNGCWGAVEFDQILGQEVTEKGCILSETAGQLILCSSPAPHAVYLKTIKKKIPLACVSPRDTIAALERLAPVFPQFIPSGSVLETSLNNSNPVTHGPLSLFNITRIENGEDFLLFEQGATPRVARFIEKIDQERVAVVNALGIPAPTELDLLNGFWPQPQTSLYDVFHRTQAYSVTKGPKTLEHRYFFEDLPYGLVPYVRLGKKLGIQTPCLEALLTTLGLYMEEDYLSKGPCVESIDLLHYL